MKLFELFEDSSYVKDMESYIIDVITMLRSRNVDKVYMKQVSNELHKLKFFITPENLSEFLSSLEDVDTVDAATGEIFFNTGDDPEKEGEFDVEGDAESEEDKARFQKQKAKNAVNRKKSDRKQRLKDLKL